MSIVFDTPALVAFATGTSRVPEGVIALAEKYGREIIVPAGALARALYQLNGERTILREFVTDPQVTVAQLDHEAAVAIADLRTRSAIYDPIDAHTLYCAQRSYASVLTERGRRRVLDGYGLQVELANI